MSDPLLNPPADLYPPGRSDVPAPEGWTPSPLYDPFEAHIGPMFYRKAGDQVHYAIKLDERHCDGQGNGEPGLLMTFADATLGWAVWLAVTPNSAVTISQHTDFLGSARVGDLIECVPAVTRKTREIIFVKGLFRVGGEPVLSASSLWKVVKGS